MKLLTKEIQEKLIRNGLANAEKIAAGNTPTDFEPVVKLFTPWAQATWLFTELEVEDDQVILFGLCDLGHQCPEIGRVLLSELESLKGPWGLRVERDLHFIADKTLQQYAAEARSAGAISA